uniref:Nuclease HARBI1 n=1 Tax=Cacopsylla melanoneura TaxID=428564 RepID=A0A8D8ST34_9HEMI
MPPSSYLLSDSAYELRSFNITPYSGATTAEQKEFNYQHSKVRVLIEQAFGRLKGIFRRVQKIECTKVENCTKLVSVACIFHNIAIDDNIFYLPEEIVDSDIVGDMGEPAGTSLSTAQISADKQVARVMRDGMKDDIVRRRRRHQ